MKKRLVIFAALFAAICLTACGTTGEQSGDKGDDYMSIYGTNYRQENETADQSYIFGMCYIMFWNTEGIVDDEPILDALENMGVKSIRLWLHFKHFLRTPTELETEAVQKMQAFIDKAVDRGFQLIGMNHYTWIVDGEQEFWDIGKPAYRPQSAVYQTWLSNVETSYRTLAAAFAKVKYWEIDNELNNGDFMYQFDDEHTHSWNRDDPDKNVLPVSTMAKISADLLYRGSVGIHAADNDNVTVLGGIVNPTHRIFDADGALGPNIEFMESLYDEINNGSHGSTYPDDFFQTAAWHPYFSAYTDLEKNIDLFVERNNAIYEVITRREGKDKKVFWTEMGWDARSMSMSNISKNIATLYKNMHRMPYVESVHYFRMFDSAETVGYGLFEAVTAKDAGAPKESAYAYQTAAGRNSTLDTVKKFLAKE